MRKPRNAYHHGDLRKALIERAFLALEESGPDHISLSSMARALGVSQAAPYRHFADRDELLSEVAAIGVAQFRAVLVEAVAGLSGRDALLARSRAYFRFGIGNPGLYKLMYASRLLLTVSGSGPPRSLALQNFQQLVDLAGAAGEAHPQRAAMTIWLGVHGMVMLAIHGLIDGNPSGMSDEELIEALTLGR